MTDSPMSGRRSRACPGAALALAAAAAAWPAWLAPAFAANEIVLENQLPGNPSSEWEVVGAGSLTIQGYTTDISVNRGETVFFKVKTDATDYRLDIYRMGYYGGMGARKVATVQPSAPLPQVQPDCPQDTTGLVDCGAWAVSASWDVPASATSGIYFARLVREDAISGASHVFFVVRDDDGSSDLLFQTSDATWQAYNRYGGNSFYVGSPIGRAFKVSYNRPFVTRAFTPEDWVFNAEYPMVRWLESNGYDVSYFTNVDAARRGAEILEHRVFLSVGHDEYWSGEQRAAVEAARAAGVHLAFFSSNEVFWKTRWEPAVQGPADPYRTLVCYKETHENRQFDPLPNVWTGTWRDPRFSPPDDGGRPENSLTGTIFTVNCCTYQLTVPADFSALRFWRNTSVASLPPGGQATLGTNVIGYEWDEALDNNARPAGLVKLSRTTVSVPEHLKDFGSDYAPATATHSATLYRAASGALVFASGTLQWSWGLDGFHDRGLTIPSTALQQATVNLFADMGVQPETLQPGLVPATASTDITPPASAITSPAPGGQLQIAVPVTITGTAADAGGGAVGGVEISTDGGLTWRLASGLASWSYSWTPSALGPITLKTRAVDDSGNLESPGAGLTVNVVPAPPPDQGPGGPILVVSNPSNRFTRYFAEILRAEGLNAFALVDLPNLTPALLATYDVAILGEAALTSAQVTMLSDWVTNGGNLIAMRPDPQLAGLLGVTGPAGTLANAYLQFNTVSGPGVGLEGQTMQFHGTADFYDLNGAMALATLYSNAGTATTHPAVTLRAVGPNGGQAAAFAYDLARSVVYTRQGNPAWAGQERDGLAPMRPNDLFYGASFFDPQPDWVDLNKVAIPQADEQQRLLANMILSMCLDRKPLPRLWYFPKGKKAVVVMTGDDHGNGGTEAALDRYRSLSPPGCLADEWDCIRATSYIYPNEPIPDSQLGIYHSLRFEIGLHLNTTCANWTPASLESTFSAQLGQLAFAFPSLPPSSSNRTHCLAWSDWATAPNTEVAHGIRLDTGYYYWPPTWVQNRPGMFTGSGMPMRFADLDGRMIDVYQVATQMTDESGQSYPATADALLDKALGPEGYYGAFCANMHVDLGASTTADQIIQSAVARGVPVVSARQMLDWLDGRNASSFGALNWTGSTLSFALTVGSGARNLKAMVPAVAATGPLLSLTRNGNAVSYTTDAIKGVSYAVFNGDAGNYVATYQVDTTPPVISAVSAAPNVEGTAAVTWTTNEPATSRVDVGTDPDALMPRASSPALVTAHALTLTGLASGVTYYYRVTSADVTGNAATFPAPPAAPLSFTMPAVCFADRTTADFTAGTLDAGAAVSETADGEVILAPAAGAEFSGAALPAGWTSTLWEPAGSAAVSGGLLTLDGARAGPSASFGPGRTLEFVATFGGQAGQHAGFGDTFESPPWAIVSTKDGTGLFVRSHDGSAEVETALSSGLIGTPHRFRVDWPNGTAAVTYWVDGTMVATHASLIAGSMRPLASDVTAGAGTLAVDWMRMTPYASAGTFTSRVLGAAGYSDWGQLGWTADLPAGTAIGLSARTGNTAVPDGSWTGFVPVPSSGATIGTTSRFIQYRAALSSSAPGSTPALQSVSIACTSAGDPFPPIISSVAAVPDPGGTAASITWLTDEPADSRVDYGTAPALLGSSVSSGAFVTSHGLALVGLSPNVTYYYRVSSRDPAGNSATFPAPPDPPLSFTPPFPICFTDQTGADFAAGTLAGTYVSQLADGEVMLAPTEGSEFDGPGLPSGWSSVAWEAGGAATATGGALVVDGARAGTDAAYPPGRALEFVATFQGVAFQHVGFGDDLTNAPWAIFSTGASGTGLQARTWDGSSTNDVPLPSVTLGVPHRFRIEWNAASVDFLADGSLVSSHAVTIPGSMRPLASDAAAGGATLAVDWLRMTPYGSPGSFTSRVFDGGGASVWGTASWSADTPAGTGVGLEARHGDTPVPDGSWTAFAPIPAPGAPLSGASRYLQYRATLATGDPARTPALEAVQIGCQPCPQKAPPPAIGDLQAQPVRSGNGPGATTRIQITWSGQENGAVAKVYRKGFGDYPLYRAGAEPATPPSPPAAEADGWTLTAVTAPGDYDQPPARDFWYYVIFTEDPCGHVSAVSNRTSGTLDYLLGDVSDGATACAGDNRVSGLDLSLLGAHYGELVIASDPLACVDVGPTTDFLVDSRPAPDGVLNFEELVLFAINFDPGAGLAAEADRPVPAERNDVEVVVPEPPAAVGGSFVASVVLSAAGDLQAASVELAYDPARVEPLGAEGGELLGRQEARTLLLAPRPGAVDLALLGRGLGLAGRGEAAQVRFRVKAAGAPGIALRRVQLRDVNGRPVQPGALRTAGPAPARAFLAASYPNPFAEELSVRFGLTRAGQVALAIYDVQGRRVRRLLEGHEAAGERALTWDGRDDGGLPVASGIYLVRLSAEGREFSHRVLRMR